VDRGLSPSAPREAARTVDLAVNGTLMRGLPLNHHLLDAGGTFVREVRTAPIYRLWSIDDVHPAMLRTTRSGGAAIMVEVWRLPLPGATRTLMREPPGLTLGKVVLEDGNLVLGVLAEPALIEGHQEITQYGGWREYLAARAVPSRAFEGGRA
jgi:hypothetical protein